MFYRPADGHGLPHNPFTAIVAPRPIGWISTRAATGDNLAPYSFFNAVAYQPPQVMFASAGRKDTLRNVETAGVFCVNIVSEALLPAMNATAAHLPHGGDEFLAAGLARAECESIACPRVAAAPAALECLVTQIVALKGRDNALVLGEVTGIHIADACLADGYLDLTRYHPAARLGYRDYSIVREIVTLARPD